jgi:hypothetical protein
MCDTLSATALAPPIHFGPRISRAHSTAQHLARSSRGTAPSRQGERAELCIPTPPEIGHQSGDEVEPSAKYVVFIMRYGDRWRREWDSNPRYGFPYTRFPSERLQPLGHPSGAQRATRGGRTIGIADRLTSEPKSGTWRGLAAPCGAPPHPCRNWNRREAAIIRSQSHCGPVRGGLQPPP